MSMYALSLVKS